MSAINEFSVNQKVIFINNVLNRLIVCKSLPIKLESDNTN